MSFKYKMGIGFLGFMTLVVLLPFIIAGLYDFGEKYPIIILPYSEGELLSYAITVSGLLISFVALCIALQQNDIKVSMKRTIVIEQEDRSYKEAICITNNNSFPITITSIGLISSDKVKKKAIRCYFNPAKHNLHLPIEIGAYSSESILFPNSSFYDSLKQWGNNLREEGYKVHRVIFFITLSNQRTVKLRSKSDDCWLNLESGK